MKFGLFILLTSIGFNAYFIMNSQWFHKKDTVGSLLSKESLKFKCKELLISKARIDTPGGRKLYTIERNGKTAYFMTQAFLYPEKDYSIDHTLLGSPLMYYDTRMILFAEIPHDWEISWNKKDKMRTNKD